MDDQVALNGQARFGALTFDRDTQAPTDADTAPSWEVFEDDTDTPIRTGTMTKRTSKTGTYRATDTASAANGYEVGKTYEVHVTASVNNKPGKAIVRAFRLVPAEAVTGQPKVTLGSGAHGAANAVLTAERIVVASTTTNEPGIKATGDGTAAGVECNGGPTGSGIVARAGATATSVDAALLLDGQSGGARGLRAAAGGGNSIESAGSSAGLSVSSVSGDAVSVSTTSGSGDGVSVSSFGGDPIDVGTLEFLGRAGGGLYVTTIATLATQTSFTLADGATVDDAYNDALVVIADSADERNRGLAKITDYVGATKTVTLAAAPGITIGITDKVYIVGVPTQLPAILTDTGSLLARIGAFTGSGINTVLGFFQGLMRKDASAPSDLGGTYDPATDANEGIRDRGDAAWVTGAGGSDRLLMVDTTIATLASQTSFTLTAGSADDDAYNNCTIVIEDSATSTQKAVGLVSDYVGATKTVTLKYDPAIFVMAATDKVYILAENALKAAAANRQVNVSAAGNADAMLQGVLGTPITESTGGRIAGNFDTFYDNADAATTKTVDDVGSGGGGGLTPLASGTAQGGTASTIQLAAASAFGDDDLNGNTVKITAGTGAGQSRPIIDYVGATDTATVTPDWATTPDASSVYEVVEGTVNVAAVGLVAQTPNDNGADLALITGADGVVVEGTIKTLDALDAAQDAQHGTTQASIASLNNLSAADANAQCDLALADAGVTGARMGYVDKLNVTGLVASQADVQGITQAQRVRVTVPTMERPDAGSTTYRLWVYAYDEQHKAEDLDSIPTVTAENNTATDRSVNLGTVTKPAATTGVYYVDYTVADTHAIEGLVFKVDATEGGVTTQYAASSIVTDTTAVDFTAADRAKLDALHDTRLTAARAGFLDNLNGHTPQTADHTAAIADIPTVAEFNARTLLAADYFDPAADTVANVALVATTTSNTDMRGTDGALLASAAPANFAALVITAGGSVDALVQGYLDAPLSEATAGRIAANFKTFFENADAATTKTVNDVGSGGGGGGTTVVLGPLVATRDPANRTSAPIALEMFQHEDKTFSLAILDSAGVGVDLSGMTLRFVVTDSNSPPNPAFDVEAGSITVSGTLNEIADVAVTAAQAATAGTEYRWLLWDLTGGRVLSHGPLTIKPSIKDVA